MRKHVYRQKFQTTFLEGTPISALGFVEGRLWVGTQEGLHTLSEGQLRPAGLSQPVTRIRVAPNGTLWVGTTGGLYYQTASGWTRVGEDTIQAFCLDAEQRAWWTDGHTVVGPRTFTCDAEIRDLLWSRGKLWLATDQGLFAGEQRWTTEDGLLSDDLRALMDDGVGHLWIATPAGINLFDGEGCFYPLTGKNGLPYEDVRQVVRGPQGERWVVTSIGAARYASGRWEYYAGRRWLPSDEVTAIAVGPEGDAWIGTAEGLAHIERRTYDFEQKAAYFEQRIAARHYRHGFVASCHLKEPGNLDSFVHYASDNDGLWTALYVAAESFRFAVTGDSEARERARRSMRALMMLEEKTPLPGFPARAIVRKDEQVELSHGEWHEAEDGEWLWKGDTSSDEIDGHMFAYGIYYDLVADEQEKREIAEVVGRIMGSIVDHDFLLIDIDGERTRWGVWSPRYLNGPWKDQQGLNSLEILSHLKTAYHITGNERFQAAYESLIREHHYALNTIDQKIVPPGIVNHSDDELAFLAYYSLLNYERDPDLRSLYLLSLERQWQYERPEHCPLWNFMYGALTGNPCDAEAAIQTLEQIPMDLINWTMRNSHRADITLMEREDRFDQPQSTVALPADERRVMKWNGNPFQLDGGDGGRSEDDGAFFLIAYWLGRYHGFVA